MTRLPTGPTALRLAAALCAIASLAVAVLVSGIGAPMDDPYAVLYACRPRPLDGLYLLGRGLTVSAVLWAGAVLADTVAGRSG